MELWRMVVCALGVLGACGGGGPRAPRATAPSSAAALVAQAQALERGVGTARDYRAAAERYRAACDDGRGQAYACGALIRARLKGRGVEANRDVALALASKVCQARRDPFGCVVADMLSGSEDAIPEPLHTTVLAVLDDLEPCDVAHLSECHAWNALGALDFGDGSTAQARRRAAALAQCRVDIFEACHVFLERSSEAGAREIAEVTRRLQVACDRGDADACAYAPQRTPIAQAALCAASDFAACEASGCTGEPARCGPARPAEPEPIFEDRIAKVRELRDAMCACKDKACADGVTARLTAWSEAEAKQATEPGFSNRQLEALRGVAMELSLCMGKLMMETTP